MYLRLPIKKTGIGVGNVEIFFFFLVINEEEQE